MSKFRFYITDISDGSIKGTDDPATAENLAQSDDYFIVDTEDGKMLGFEGDRYDIKDVNQP